MSIAEIVALVATGGTVSLLSLIEISPIKAKPLTWLFSKLGKAINKEMLLEQRKTQADLQELSREFKEHKACECRSRILRFGDEVLHGRRHSKDHFEQILLDIKKYDQYCANHREFENGVTEPTSKRIKEVYQHCLEQNDFL
ncbi:MAG: hypothetical protein IJ465_05005 [Clostridia bacterium]|nr:hypothetical protein [Clostridia bacterium]